MNDDEVIFEEREIEKKKYIKNRMIALIIAHCFELIGITFSISYYRWYELAVNHEEYVVWINLLYVYDNFYGYMTFDNYRKSDYYYCGNEGYCRTNPNPEECQENCDEYFNELEFIGIVSFALLVLCAALQFVDIIRIFKYIQHMADEEIDICCIKGKFLHPIILIAGIFALLIFFLCVLFSNTFEIFDNGTFGYSYWAAFSSLGLFLIIVIYYRYTKNQLKELERLTTLLNFNDSISVMQENNEKAKINETFESHNSNCMEEHIPNEEAQDNAHPETIYNSYESISNKDEELKD